MKCKARTAGEEQFVELLRNWNEPECILLAAIQEAVSANTFRGFTHLRSRPSEVYRDWAKGWLVVGTGFRELSKLGSIDDYDKWLERGVDKLQEQWGERAGGELGTGPAYKLANLLLKRISRELPPKQKARVFGWLHVPLDRYTLNAIRGVVVLPGGRQIPANATMGYVANTRDYRCIQQIIRGLARRAKVPPIALDYSAFNAR